MKRLAWFSTVILATLTVAVLFWEFRSAVVLFIISLIIAATIRPAVDWLSARGMSRGLALLLAYVMCVGSLITLFAILSGPLLTDVQQFTKDITSGYEQIRTQWPNGSPFQQTLSQQMPVASDLYAAIIGPQGGTLVQTALGVTLGSFDLLGQLLICLVLSLYWSADQEHFKRLWLSLLPFDMRARARAMWQKIEATLGGYMRGQVIQSVLALLVLSVGYQLLGLRYPAALALIGTIGWLIPWIGILLAIIPVMLVGLSISPVLTLLTGIFTLMVFAFLGEVVEPRLFNRRPFSSLLVVIIMLIMVDQFGLIGILVAPPLAAAIQIFASMVIRSIISPITPQIVQSAETLRLRLKTVETTIAMQDIPSRSELANFVERLDQLILRGTRE